MKDSTLAGRLNFLREAERLKNVLRSGFTSSGRPESTAEHSWRLALMALVFADQLPGLDIARVLKLCVVHDLGEAIHGDIPAIHQHAHPGKSAQEREDLHILTRDLDPSLRAEIIALWDEYEAAATPEAQAVKAFDKLETILQHNQGDNPPDFDYAFNLGYGRKHTATAPLFATLREMLDAETSQRGRSTSSQ
ncbi:HD domain-containing protein [Pseudoduganella violaceinigra]|uniref:HD domain-containing protein n=1 Tax=Pseudoduganella violaceinigra TaxID=246602 RepID=UPI00041E06B4|nr:HD domain-containing protein [Pseudoduganella violaceinigra]